MLAVDWLHIAGLRADRAVNIQLPLPPSTNAMWRSLARMKGGKPFVTVVLSAEGRQFKKDAATWLLAQRTEVLAGPVSVRIVVYFPNRRGDMDNRIKPILDVLQGVAFMNDSQVEHLEVRRDTNPLTPCALVTVEPLDVGLPLGWSLDDVVK